MGVVSGDFAGGREKGCEGKRKRPKKTGRSPRFTDSGLRSTIGDSRRKREGHNLAQKTTPNTPHVGVKENNHNKQQGRGRKSIPKKKRIGGDREREEKKDGSRIGELDGPNFTQGGES